jgi:hypothetical protein
VFGILNATAFVIHSLSKTLHIHQVYPYIISIKVTSFTANINIFSQLTHASERFRSHNSYTALLVGVYYEIKMTSALDMHVTVKI